MGDMVNSPEHYNTYGMEAIDVIENSMTREEFLGYLKGNALKYIIRYRLKGKPEQDINKSIWYLEKLKEVLSRG